MDKTTQDIILTSIIFGIGGLLIFYGANVNANILTSGSGTIFVVIGFLIIFVLDVLLIKRILERKDKGGLL